MISEMSISWDGRPEVESRLSAEMFESVGAPVPDLTDEAPRPRTIGSAVARRDGVLLGWGWVFEDEQGGDGAARVQALYVPREVRRITNGGYDLLAPPGEEFIMVEGLCRQAARAAQRAGYEFLRWSGADTGPEGRAATALLARTQGEYARTWSTDPATWRAPVGLPDVLVRLIPGPDLTLATSEADVSARVEGTMAYINAAESIHHRNAGLHTLAAVISALVTRLQRDHPHVTELNIFEFQEATALRQALTLAGLHVSSAHHEFELPLGQS